MKHFKANEYGIEFCSRLFEHFPQELRDIDTAKELYQFAYDKFIEATETDERANPTTKNPKGTSIIS